MFKGKNKKKINLIKLSYFKQKDNTKIIQLIIVKTKA